MDIFKRVREAAITMAGSEAKFAEGIGLTQQKINRYLREQSPKLWNHLPQILSAFPAISREWLYFGEGGMLRGDAPTPPPSVAGGAVISPAVPVVGLAACGIDGIEQIMPYAVTAAPIVLGPRSLAVVAFGESMVPAGIASGQMCFCDPDQPALPGEAVFLRRKDDKGALKLFLGRGERAGYTVFKGWLAARDEYGHQKPLIMDVPDDYIDCIAPVVFVRRRL